MATDVPAIGRLGLLLGSGSAALTAVANGEAQAAATPWGVAAAPLRLARCGALQVISLMRHGEPHLLAPHRINYRANVWALHQAGAQAIVAVNTVGGIAPHMPAGTLVTPHQLIDYSWGRDSSFDDGDQRPLRHVDLTQPFDATLSQQIRAAAIGSGQTIVKTAVYAVTQGPRLETAAEVSRLARDGCDIVGMTAMPEAALAAELAIPYAMLALVVNPAAGLGVQRIEQKDIDVVLDEGMIRVNQVLEALIYSLSSALGDQGSA